MGMMMMIIIMPFVDPSGLLLMPGRYDVRLMAKHPLHILELARKGAEVKYQELQSEIAALVRQFPHLRKGNGAVGKARGLRPVQDAAASSSRRRKRAKMSAAARKAVSLRMRKYWAQRRAAQEKK
jgi:hypothetical protein